MTHPRNQSLADNILEHRKLRKQIFENQAKVIKAYEQMLGKALESDNVREEVQEVKDELHEFSAQLKQMAEETI